MTNIGASIFQRGYEIIKPLIFQTTKNNPELAHHNMIRALQFLDKTGMAKFFLDNMQRGQSQTPISNAAGFNKDGTIPTSTLKYLGFDRNVVGTVTNKPWKGNPDKQRIWRFPQTNSLVNFLGLPGVGSEQVARNLNKYHKGELPLTINVMSTPQREGGLEEEIKDILTTLEDLKDFGDRIELNISCPNTHNNDSQTRIKYQENLARILDAITPKLNGKELYLKVSPDMDKLGVYGIIDACEHYNVTGFTTTNTTTSHNSRFIQDSPGKGGASGRAVLEDSLKVQQFINELGEEKYKIIACGGIEDAFTARQRIQKGAEELQVYTGLIYKGPQLISDLRRC